jgi:hypothetical protein
MSATIIPPSHLQQPRPGMMPEHVGFAHVGLQHVHRLVPRNIPRRLDGFTGQDDRARLLLPTHPSYRPVKRAVARFRLLLSTLRLVNSAHLSQPSVCNS